MKARPGLSGELKRLFDLPNEGFGLWLLTHADLRQTARVRAFVDFISEAVRSEIAPS
ncbi:MAG: hypothetical protein KC912_25055 [Proteobacteria bacterium]|nr:hypothetical protein [Pseudomonadota bacterium]